MKLLNRTFFRFTFGFVAIILVGILGVWITGYYDGSRNNLSATEIDNVDLDK